MLAFQAALPSDSGVGDSKELLARVVQQVLHPLLVRHMHIAMHFSLQGHNPDLHTGLVHSLGKELALLVNLFHRSLRYAVIIVHLQATFSLNSQSMWRK